MTLPWGVVLVKGTSHRRNRVITHIPVPFQTPSRFRGDEFNGNQDDQPFGVRRAWSHWFCLATFDERHQPN